MILAGISVPDRGVDAAILLVLATVWGIFSSISYEKSRFVVTETRVFIKAGLLWRRSYDLPLQHVEGVKVYQPSLGKVLNFGKITFKTRSGRRLSFRLVRDPLQFGNVVLENRQRGRGSEGEPPGR